MKIVFSSEAKSDLIEFVRFISLDKPMAARKWANTIRQNVLKLADFPKFGRVVPEFGEDSVREIISGQYRIVYKIDEKNETIVIVTIHHSKRPL
jgi:toxin ParE1/3/4